MLSPPVSSAADRPIFLQVHRDQLKTLDSPVLLLNRSNLSPGTRGIRMASFSAFSYMVARAHFSWSISFSQAMQYTRGRCMCMIQYRPQIQWYCTSILALVASSILHRRTRVIPTAQLEVTLSYRLRNAPSDAGRIWRCDLHPSCDA